MGKQINFFMTVEDERAFVEALKAQSPCVLIRNTSKHAQLSQVEGLAPLTDDPSLVDVSLVRLEDVSEVRTELIAAQQVYAVDVLNSPVVQWSRCRMMTGWLASGRLWFEESANDGKKKEAFRRWAKSVVSWPTRNYEPLNGRPYLVGPSAAKKAATGELQLGPPTRGMSSEEMRRVLGLERS